MVPEVQQNGLLFERSFPFFLVGSILTLSLLNGLTEPSLGTLLWRTLMVLLSLSWVLREKKSQAWQYAPIRWYFLFLIWMGISIFWANSPCLAWQDLEMKVLVLFLWMMVYDLYREEQYRQGLRRVCRFVLGVGLLYGLYQLIFLFPLMRDMANHLTQNMDGTMEKRYLIRLRSTEVFGLRLYPNLFGLFAGLGCIVLLEGAFNKGAWFVRLMLCLAFVMLVLSGSKGALLITLLGAMVYGAMRGHAAQCLSLKAILVILLTGCFFLGFTISWWFPLVEASVRVRWDYWQSAWGMICQHPMGVGAGMFSQWYPQYMTPDATEVQLLHNEHLQILCEGGWVALLIHVCFCASLLWPHLKNIGQIEVSEEPFQSWGRRATLYWICGIAMMSMLLPGQMIDVDVGPMLWWGVILGFWWLNFKVSGRSISSLLKLTLGLVFLMHASIDFSFHDPFLMLLFFVFLLPDSKLNPEKSSEFFLYSRFNILNACPSSIVKSCGWGVVLLCLLSLWYQQKLFLFGLQMNNLAKISDEDLTESLDYLRKDPRSWDLILKNFKAQLASDLQLERQQYWIEQSLIHLTRLKPHSANLWKQRALLSRDDQERKNFLLLAESLHPRQAQYAFLLAEQLYKMGDMTTAKVYYQKALDRHRYALSRQKLICDMELHLLSSEQAQKTCSRL